MSTSLFRELRPFLIVGWVTALARYIMDWRHMDSMTVGVYYQMAAVFLFCGLIGYVDHWRWKRIFVAAAILAVLVWGLPNLIAYGTAQFEGWTHGRFAADRGPEIGETTGEKIMATLGVTGVTCLVGFVWSSLWLSLCVGVGRMRRRQRYGC